MKTSRQKKIALIGMPVLRNPFDRMFASYASEPGHWRCVFSAEEPLRGIRALSQLHCDGAIARIMSPQMARIARRLPFPVVNVSSWLENPGVPTCRRDDHAMGRLCAEHLLEKGFRRFGCVLMPGGWYIQSRYSAFVQTVKAAGFGVKVFVQHAEPISRADQLRFCRWGSELQSPAGVFLTDDIGAPTLLDLCRKAGQRIPQDLAVICAHGYAAILERCEPPLTYCDEDYEAVAQEAAAYLDRLMSKTTTENRILEIPPRGIVALASTDTFAVDDREVAKAVEFIRARSHLPINVADVVQQVAVSRKTLERRFQAAMRLSLHDYLIRERISRVKDLIEASPRRSLNHVAKACGFNGRKQLNRVFKNVTGVLPFAWRESQRKARSA